MSDAIILAVIFSPVVAGMIMTAVSCFVLVNYDVIEQMEWDAIERAYQNRSRRKSKRIEWE